MITDALDFPVAPEGSGELPNIDPSNPAFPFVTASLAVVAGSMHLLGSW